MNIHNMFFSRELEKIIPELSPNTPRLTSPLLLTGTYNNSILMFLVPLSHFFSLAVVLRCLIQESLEICQSTNSYMEGHCV